MTQIPVNVTITPEAPAQASARMAKIYLDAVELAVASIQPVIDGLESVLEVHASLPEIQLVEAKLTEIQAVAASISNVNSVAGALTAVNAVSLKLTELTTLYTNLAALLNLNDNIAAVTAVNAAITNVNSVAGALANIQTVVTNMTAIQAAPQAAVDAAAAKNVATEQAGIATTKTAEAAGHKTAAQAAQLASELAAASSGAPGSESDAIQLLRLHNPDLVFSGFVNTSTSTPSHTANKAYIATEPGTVFGKTVVKGSIIWSNGIEFVVESVIALFESQKNKYNPALAVDGKYYNNTGGTVGIAAGYSITNLIPVLPSTAYSLWKTGAAFAYLHFFDVNRAWLGNQTTITATVISGGYSFTTPANCYFIATWVPRGTESFEQFKNLVMLELGSKTTFEAYTIKMKESLVNAYTKSVVDADILEAKNSAIETAIDYCDAEVLRLSAILPNNLIIGEGTETPTIITNGNGTNVTISAVANDLIFPSEYAYKRRYSAPAASGSTFINWPVNYPATKPTIISFAYWVKDSDIDTVFAGKGSQQHFWFYDQGSGAIHVLYFDHITIKAAVGTTVTGTFNYTGKITGKWKVTCIDKQDGYSRISICYFDIVYDPSYIKTYFILYHIFNSVPAQLNSQSIDYVGFTLVFNEEITFSSVYPDSAGKIQYPPVPLSLKQSIDSHEIAINELSNAVYGKIKVLRTTNYLFIRTNFNTTKDLVKRFSGFGTGVFVNEIILVPHEFLINVSDADTEAVYNAGINIMSSSDDSCPNNYNGTYIGANHGNSAARKITAIGHGKTSVDIGSEWVDGSGRKYYILRIVDANNLWIISENIGTADIFSFDSALSGVTLTHSAGATNTGTITFTVDAMEQLLPAIKNSVKKILLDGKTEVTANGLYYADFVDVVDQYDTVNTASMLANLIADVGTNYDNTQLHAAFQNGDPSVFNQICYRVQKNGALVIHYGWRTYHEIYLGYMGFMQAVALPQTTYPNLKVYMPKVLPYVAGAKTWDLRIIENFNTAPTIPIDLNSTYWENPLLPPDRLVEYLCDASNVKKIGFAMGYDITKGIGALRKDLVTNAWSVYTSRKSYPHGIDSILGNIAANTWFSCIAYRIFFDAESTDKGNATNLYYYELGKDLMVYFDAHSTLSFENLKLPAEHVGKSVTVVEKSSNVTIHTSEVMQDGITVSVGVGAYAYCVLKVS